MRVNDLFIKRGSRVIIKGLNLTIPKKGVFGVIGLSGSGKSSILLALMDLINYSGVIDWGERVIGYCPQGNAFFADLSILENIRVFSWMLGVNYKAALVRAKSLLKELLINEPLTKRAGDLSGGQMKRLNIVLSLLHNPRVVILDEPFAGLDYVTRLLLWGFIKRLGKRSSVLLTTHLLSEAQDYCNHLLIIGGDKPITGSISELKRSLKFREFLRVRFSYISKTGVKRLTSFCESNGLRVFNISEAGASFALPGVDERKRLLSYLKRSSVKFRVVELRPPMLNELFVVSVA